MSISLDPDGFNELRVCRTGPLIYNKNDIYIGGSSRKYGEFSWLEHELLKHLVRPGEIVVEAGANIGAHTVGVSRLVGATGGVIAFEPQRIVFQTLCANLALNQCSNVYAFQQALGAADGEITVPALDPRTRSNFGGISLTGVARGDKVPLRTVDGLGLPACHLIKGDVEGMELDLVRGALATIKAYRPILYLENDREEHSKSLLELLLSLDYAAYWHLPPLYNPDNFERDPENIFPGIVSLNVLCTPLEAKIPVAGLRRIVSPGDSWKI